MPRVAVVVIGNEILSGKVDDLNAKFAARHLRELGADLERIAVVPDTLTAIAAEVRACAGAFDVVVTSGGVGPTHDDITYEGVAEAFGVGLAEDPKVARLLAEYFGDGLTDDHLRMARFPRGAEVHMGGGLPLPVVSVRNVYVLPGIPMLFEASLRALGERLRGAPIFLRDVFCRRDEGTIAAALRRVQVAYADLALGSYPSRDEHGRFRVRITVEGRDELRVDEAARLVRDAVGPEGAG